MGSARHVTRVLALGLALALVSASAHAAGSDEGLGHEAGMGLAAAAFTLVYGPAKIVYATAGSMIAGLAWAFSGGDADVARPILTAALRGDYVITPDHIRGKRPIEFVGRDPADRRLRESVSPGY